MGNNDSNIDWSILRGSIIFLILCLVICSGLIGGSYYFNDSQNRELKRNKAIFTSISRKYLDVDQEEKLVQDFYPQFVKLYNKGIIGREQRLNWIEALRQSGEQIKLPALRYSINSQQEYTPGFDINYQGYKLYRSTMELNLGLLHEGDLFKLLNYINKNANGTYTISECSFELDGIEIKYDKNHTNISAKCMLHWITIDLDDDRRIEIG